jgi:hypothetical protein
MVRYFFCFFFFCTLILISLEVSLLVQIIKTAGVLWEFMLSVLLSEVYEKQYIDIAYLITTNDLGVHPCLCLNNH